MLKEFTGIDIHIQKNPFLRIARPNKIEDNIGFHRDTLYGQSQFEVSVHVPLVDLDKISCLRFMPNSHTYPDNKFKIHPVNGNNVKKGSKKHEMGYPYSPKIPRIDEKLMIPKPLKIGQAVIFPPSTVHGQKLNCGSKTRFTFDFRIVNICTY